MKIILQSVVIRNYPLDVYFLMDSTKKLVSIGEEMARTLGNLTKNIRFGFGTFADKPYLMPYIAPEMECPYDCGPIYPFTHCSGLTNDMEIFLHKVY